VNVTAQNTTVHEVGFEALDSLPLDALCVFVAQDERPLKGLAGYVDWRMCGALSRVLKQGFFVGDRDDCLLLPSEGRIAMARVFAVGYGSAQKHTPESLGHALTQAAKILSKANIQAVALELPGAQTLDEGVRADSLLSRFAPAFAGEKVAVLAEKSLSRALFPPLISRTAP
jgi:hypothetical protein